MNISLLQVLNAPLFENVKILSGRAGLGRIVKRASVIDAPFGASCKRKLQWALCDDGGESRAFFERNACFL